jgi:hypothetical protein
MAKSAWATAQQIEHSMTALEKSLAGGAVPAVEAAKHAVVQLVETVGHLHDAVHRNEHHAALESSAQAYVVIDTAVEKAHQAQAAVSTVRSHLGTISSHAESLHSDLEGVYLGPDDPNW